MPESRCRRGWSGRRSLNRARASGTPVFGPRRRPPRSRIWCRVAAHLDSMHEPCSSSPSASNPSCQEQNHFRTAWSLTYYYYYTWLSLNRPIFIRSPSITPGLTINLWHCWSMILQAVSSRHPTLNTVKASKANWYWSLSTTIILRFFFKQQKEKWPSTVSCHRHNVYNQSQRKTLDQSTAKDFSFSATLEGTSPTCQSTSVRVPSCSSVLSVLIQRFNSVTVQGIFAHAPTEDEF